jgi:hypothetical protein
VENLLGPLFIHLRGRVLTNLVSSVVRAAEEASVKRVGKEPDPQMREGVMMPNMGFKHSSTRLGE